LGTPLPRNSPLGEHDDLSKATQKKLKDQLRWELAEVKKQSGKTHEDLAGELGYQGGASVSRWLSGGDPVPPKAAKALDELGYKTTIGVSFTELQEAYRKAKGPTRPPSTKTADTFDIFLASPMASLTKKSAFDKERKAAKDLKELFEEELDYSVYYAGEKLESKEEFDSPVAAERNFDALRNSSYFVLLSVTKADRPSSVTVEAGYALGCEIPSIYLLPHAKHLPFVLRSLGSHKSNDLPPVRIELVGSSRQAVSFVRHNGRRLLKELDEEVATATPPGTSRRRPKSR
jgi:transcriptional regulator with XRE-family HTH domain